MGSMEIPLLNTEGYLSAINSYNTLHALIQERHDGLKKAITTGDVESFLSYYSDDIRFCDWTHNIYMIGKAQLRTFFTDIFAKLAPITIHDATLNCTSPDFVTWEFEKRFTVVGAMAHLGREPGQKIKKRACLVQHWRLEPTAEGKLVWRIWKENDYGQRDQRDE
ncbi:hypothetical protein DV735_g3681, partial [Chaetothyriales sp. CBS 134920]